MQNILKFQKDLKIKFKNKSLLVKALTHKSSNQKKNNESLDEKIKIISTKIEFN